MGATILGREAQEFYEETSMPMTARSQFSDSNSLRTFNIFLAAIFGPLIAALALKVMSATAFKANQVLKKAYKYALGTFTFYGIMFLSYGQFAALALCLRTF